MIRGFLAFLTAFFLVSSHPEFRRWYRRALARTMLASFAVVLVLLASGVAATGSIFDNPWHAGFAMLAWGLAVIFLSGRMVALAASAFAGGWVDEKGLVSCVLGQKTLNLPSAAWSDRTRELIASVRSASLSLALAPLFFFPYLLPLAVIFLAWSFGREALAFGRRLTHQAGLRDPKIDGSFSFAFGLGLGPALASLVPVAGWTIWPLLQVAGVLACRGDLLSGTRPSTEGFRGADPTR